MAIEEVVVCCVMGLMGLLSAATAFAAEATKIKIEFPTPLTCIYPKSFSLAVPLGITSVVSLIIGKLIFLAVVLCRSNLRRENCEWAHANIIFYVSWNSFGIALFFLLGQTVTNSIKGDCESPIPGMFGAAGVLSLVSGILDMVFYLQSVTRGKIAPISEGDTEMEHHHIPQ